MTAQKFDDLRLFLCHTSTDKNFVRKLANDLWHFDVIPWLDEWNLEPGDSLHGKIGDALERSRFVAVVLSPDSVKSKWVQKELRQALSKEDRIDDKIVIPILHRSVDLPAFLEDKIYIDFEKSYWEGLARLVGFVYKLDKRMLSNSLSEGTPKSLVKVETILKGVGWRTQAVTDAELYHAIRELFSRSGYGEISPKEFRIMPEFRRRNREEKDDDDDDFFAPHIMVE